MLENIPRVLPEGLAATLEREHWPQPPIFEWLQGAGIEMREMYRTFNCGIGMVAVVEAAAATPTIERLRAAGETAWDIGEITPLERESVVIR